VDQQGSLPFLRTILSRARFQGDGKWRRFSGALKRKQSCPMTELGSDFVTLTSILSMELWWGPTALYDLGPLLHPLVAQQQEDPMRVQT